MSELLYIYFIYAVDDPDSYISEGEVEKKEDKPQAGAFEQLAALVNPTVPLGADFGTCDLSECD